MKIEILSPNKKIYQGKSNSLTLPVREGQIQVLEDHAPLFTLLNKGEIVLGSGKKFSILSGVGEVINNKVSILVDG